MTTKKTIPADHTHAVIYRGPPMGINEVGILLKTYATEYEADMAVDPHNGEQVVELDEFGHWTGTQTFREWFAGREPTP